MKPRLTVLLGLLVLLPLGLLSWLGARVAEAERHKVSRSFSDFVRSNLAGLDGIVQALLQDRMRQLQTLVESPDFLPERLASTVRTEPTVNCFFLQASDGRLLFPDPEKRLSEAEKEFLVRAKNIFDGKMLLISGADPSPAAPAGESFGNPSPAAPAGESFGNPSPSSSSARVASGPVEGDWFPWYWNRGLNLIFWMRDRNGDVRGAELDRVRMLSDIIAVLPEAPFSDPLLQNSKVELADGEDRPIYHWGGYHPPASETPFLRYQLQPPLRTWSFRFFLGPKAAEPLAGGSSVPLLIAIFAMAIALAGMALVIHRESSRDLREAEQRVTFVNQVSHELKTPLTNIRLYAELMEKGVPEEDTDLRKRLEIIVMESCRLGRLINNVLSFSKHQRGKLVLKPRETNVDETIRAVAENFRLPFSLKNLAIELALEASSPIRADPDLLEQVLGNLFNNVEKYATRGGVMKVKSQVSGGELSIFVRDFGPGIPQEKTEAVFEPFTRLADSVNEGVAGTGIGLSIARSLARLHGGDLRVIWSGGGLPGCPPCPWPEPPEGTCFLITVRSLPQEERQ